MRRARPPRRVSLPTRRLVRTLAGAVAMLTLAVALPASAAAPTPQERVARVLTQTPLIDGHNDLPWEIRTRFGGDLAKIDLAASTAGLPAPPPNAPLMTDIPRLRRGHVGAQFWSVWVPVESKGAHDSRADRSGQGRVRTVPR
jgi:membrane dipeptidase